MFKLRYIYFILLSIILFTNSSYGLPYNPWEKLPSDTVYISKKEINAQNKTSFQKFIDLFLKPKPKPTQYIAITPKKHTSYNPWKDLPSDAVYIPKTEITNQNKTFFQSLADQYFKPQRSPVHNIIITSPQRVMYYKIIKAQKVYKPSNSSKSGSKAKSFFSKPTPKTNQKNTDFSKQMNNLINQSTRQYKKSINTIIKQIK